MEEPKASLKNKKNWNQISIVLVSFASLGVIHLIADYFFDFNVVHYAIWPLWPALIFILYRFVRPLPKDEGQERREFWRLAFYCFAGVIAVLGRAFTHPFSNFEEMACVAHWIYPLLFPLVMRFGMPGRNAFRFIVFSAYVVFLVLSTLLVGINYSLNRGYYDFLSRDQNYYTKVAKACNELLLQPKPSSGVLELQGDDKLVPPILRDFHPRKIFSNFFSDENKNYVGIEVGVSRSGFGISWGRSDHGNDMWELSIVGDSGGTVVYSAQKTVDSKR